MPLACCQALGAGDLIHCAQGALSGRARRVPSYVCDPNNYLDSQLETKALEG